MTESFSSPFFGNDLDLAFFASDALITHLLVFSARAFIVLHRAENAFAEQAAKFWFMGTIVDGFRIDDFTMGPTTNRIWGSKADLHRG